MILATQPRRVVETSERRVLGAFRLVDAVTRLPIGGPATVEARSLVLPGVPGETRLGAGSVRLLQNRAGMHVVLSAPFFETYTSTFDDPQAPPEAQAGPIRVRLAVLDAGVHYLPQQFEMRVPRSLDPSDEDSVFEPQAVGLFRAPSAPAQDGWAVLRVRVTQGATQSPLPGVLVRVFRSPRGAADAPIGAGMTDWRGAARGEALVPVTGIQRFRPGAGDDVIEREQVLELEATRDSGFTASATQLPDVPRILEGTGDGVIRPPNRPPGSALVIVQPATGVRVQAGREYVVRLAMP
jgi:hypothetical protein